MFDVRTYSYDNDTEKILFVSACREETKEIPFVYCLDKMNLSSVSVSIDIAITYGNTDGLSTVYNRYLNDEQIKEYDYVIFLHDDIWLNDVLLFDKISSVSKYYDIIGVCGGKTWKANRDTSTPISWTSATKDAGGSGYMLHCLKNEDTNEKYEHMNYFSSNYGISPAKTMTLDGCFLCLTKKAIQCDQCRFDEQFKFHYYDIDFCTTAYINHLTLGTAPILITHESLGEGVYDKSYLEAQKLYLDKWFKKYT